MKQFEYTVKAADGIHARPAGMIASKAMKFKSTIIMKCGGKEASVKKLFALMKLGVKKDDRITVTFDGEDEEEAYKVITADIGANY